MSPAQEPTLFSSDRMSIRMAFDILLVAVFDGIDPTEFDLVVRATDNGRCFGLWIGPRPGFLGPSEVHDIAYYFSSSLTPLIEYHRRMTQDLQLVGSATLDRIWEWKRALPPPVSTSICDLVSERTFVHPEKTAVESPYHKLTYTELEELATDVAIK